MNVPLCTGQAEAIWEKLPLDRQVWFLIPWHVPRPVGVRRKTMRCPACGRRLKSSVEYYHDGDYIIHTLPPHKPKGWRIKPRHAHSDKGERMRRR